ncbi:fasciclin domain-containing protein [Gemmata sp. G18]|uniref:Fasciclin domain-containing protein n=1 Tax=Gemmata palustris TaxID=2822762 RepID=A0ABS5BJS3_9BACT|nr:fasciclin domain-containing protein [Gemmata palustris]MBP3953727.1 fasciclin domain-containing protein [Gemmata palustris]
MRPKLTAGAVLATVLALALPARTADTGTIYDTLTTRDGHTVLSVAVKEAAESAALKGTTQYTLFAPLDSAFKKLDDTTIGEIATKKDVVQRLLRSHLVMGKYTTADLKKLDGKELKTVHGNVLKVEDTKDGLLVGGVKIVTADIVCSNGVIHTTDAILPMPKE